MHRSKHRESSKMETHRNSQKKKKRGRVITFKSIYEVYITLIPKPENTTRKERNRPICLMTKM